MNKRILWWITGLGVGFTYGLLFLYGLVDAIQVHHPIAFGLVSFGLIYVCLAESSFIPDWAKALIFRSRNTVDVDFPDVGWDSFIGLSCVVVGFFIAAFPWWLT